MKKLYILLSVCFIAAGILFLYYFANVKKGDNQNLTLSKYCTDKPVESDIGRLQYPIDVQYKHLTFLGEFFTAYNCGTSRLKSLPAVSGNEYTYGVTLWLESNPSEALIKRFKDLNFLCVTGEASTCKQWSNENSIDMYDLIKLETFHNEFIQDDCINCG